MALSNAQLLMLDNLIYTKFVGDGKTVGEIVTEMENHLKAGGTIDCCKMTEKDWTDLISAVKNEPDLQHYTVANYQNDPSTGMRAACFIDDLSNPGDVNVVFRGTSGNYEWHDNGEGGYLSDTAQQERAAEYVISLPDSYGDAMTVTGHSKGGNKAQYVTIVTDRIARCVSFDGQGFSQEFLDKYSDRIAKRSQSIVSISASDDYVNCLLFPIAGMLIYIETEQQEEFIEYHKPNIMLDTDGNLRRQCEQSELSKLINEYTTYMIATLPEPERSITVDGLIALLESGDDKESIWQTLFAGVVAVSHADDFAFNYIGDTYGFPARAAATYLAAVACPFLFMDDLLECGKDMAGSVLGTMNSLATVINRKLILFGERAKAFGAAFVKGVSSFAAQVIGSYNMLFNRGYQYAVSNTYIELNTAVMRAYADRLNTVNRRICDLDARMDALYKKVGLRDLLSLLKADLMTGYNRHITGCARYLNETANDFDSVERDISSQY